MVDVILGVAGARGEGEQAVLDYLARYVFRVAITNARIVGLDDEAVTTATSIANPTGGGPAASPARSSCAASSSMSCPRACTRSATSACGIPSGARMPPAPGCCFCSTLRRRRFEPRSARTPPIRPPTRNSRTIRASALAAARVVSCLSASAATGDAFAHSSGFQFLLAVWEEERASQDQYPKSY